MNSLQVLLIGDIDNDGNLELVLGLTDRVVRSYRWTQNITGGKLVCLNKWECANQIGNVTINYDNAQQPSLLISQPGGTFMRIRCQTDLKNNRYTIKYILKDFIGCSLRLGSNCLLITGD